MPLITEMFCFAVFDSSPDDEGVPAFGEGRFLLPMMGADLAMVERLIPVAQKFADDSGKPIPHLQVHRQRADRRGQSADGGGTQSIHRPCPGRGYAACGFGLPSFPDNWPEGHMWTGSDAVEKVTCPKCLEARNIMNGYPEDARSTEHPSILIS